MNRQGPPARPPNLTRQGLDPNDFPALGAPPPPPQVNGSGGAATAGQSSYASANQGVPPALPPNASLPQSYATNTNAHPQTPAQQVLVSAADRWGLLGLLLSIKNAAHDPDGGLSAFGTDLGTMGLDMGVSGNLHSLFITPWSDSSAARSVEPHFHLPASYNVAPPPPGPAKVAGFSDETLFFMFYSSPRDALQEVAAGELYNRNWRFHKPLRLWITKESGMHPSHKVPGGERGEYHVWDPEAWVKERREMVVMYGDLEERGVGGVGQPIPGSQANMSTPAAMGLGAQGARMGMQTPAPPASVRVM